MKKAQRILSFFRTVKEGDPVNKNVRMALTVLLLAVFLFSAVKLVTRFLEDKQMEEVNRVAEELAQAAVTEPEESTAAETAPPETETAEQPVVWIPEPVENDSYMETLALKDLEALREVNPDVIGWIWIPETKIDYPLLQGEDNSYYLERTWDERPNGHGSIFLECKNSPDLTDFNTIIYGHNMLNGSMFSQLQDYKNESFWKAHPYVYILTDEGVFRYEIFSSYAASVDSITYQLSFRQTETREAFISNAQEKSNINTGIVPETTDRIITLSTCTGAGYSSRRVVHARLRMIEAE